MKTKILVIISIFFILFACDNTTDPEPDSELAISYVDSARIALENVLYQLINNDQIEPEDIDFSEPQRLFKLAHKSDPDNLDANFGLAITNFLIINQEEETNALFNDWQEFFEGSNQGFAKKGETLKPEFPKSVKDFAIPNKKLVRGMINLPKAALTDPPKFNDVQEYVENIIMPLLDFAIEALDDVDDNPDYKFMVSPRMQGDEMADSVEIDLGEIYALEVMLNMLNTFANLTVAYNVDFWDYDSLEAIEVFSKGGDFLKLRSGDKPMNNVKKSFFTALDKTVAGLQFIFNETDSQHDDLIRPDDLTQEDLNNVIVEVNNIKNTISTPQVYIEDWDNNPSTPQEALTVDYSKIFDDPIEDLKSVLPDYNIEVNGTEISDQVWDQDNKNVYDQVEVETGGNYSYSRSYYWDKYGTEYSSKNSDVEFPNFDSSFDSLVTALKLTDGLEWIDISLYWQSSLSRGLHNVNGNIWYTIVKNVIYLELYLPSSFTWQATTFDQWTFPNPTFNGLFPNMTDSEFKRIFGISEENWN